MVDESQNTEAMVPITISTYNRKTFNQWKPS